MPIYRKTAVAPYLKELDAYYKMLRDELEGVPPSAALADHYRSTPEDFERDFTHVDLDALYRAIGHFKVSVDSIKQLKNKEKHAQKRHFT